MRHLRFAISTPAELAGLVPRLVGFQPTLSLVILLFRGKRFMVSARLDLPRDHAELADFTAAIQDVALDMADRGVTTAIIVGYGPEEPVATVATATVAVLTDAGIVGRDVLRVENDRVYSLLCTDPDCCPPSGTPFDAATTVSAATATYAGLTALPDRETLAAQLSPTTGPERDAFTEASRTARADMLARLEASCAPDEELLKMVRTAWADASTCYQSGGRFDDVSAAAFTVLLEHPAATATIALHTRGDHWQIRMWMDLVRRTDLSAVATVAGMLALSAMQSGSGALAWLAIDSARAADPGNRLAWILARIHALNVAPEEITAALRAAAEANTF